MESSGAISATQAKTVLARMIESGEGPASIAGELGFEAMPSDELEMIVDGLIAAHADEWAKLLAGEQKVMGFFVGAAMKATGGKADGKAVSAILNQRRS